ncbi:TraB domain-containing protein, partial [uncultured Holdemania sp.]
MEKQWTTLQTGGKEITLIGTAHVSKVSAQQVKEALEEIHPDSICVELDEDRYQSLMHPGQWEQTDIVQVIKQKKTGFLLANIILSSYQKKIAKKMDISAGAEMMQGIQSAKELNAELVLADRRIQTTFSRIWRKHSFWQKCKLLTSILFSLFDDEDITEADLEQLKQSDMLESALKEVGDSFPVVADVLIHERDQYLATKIAQAKG